MLIDVDLYSDTITRPSPGMRRAMAEAEVGDEQKKEDPTVNRLCRMVADLLEKDDAIYLPSGTMCNAISFRMHCVPGDEILIDRSAHPVHFEVGGAAALAGAMVRPLDGDCGIFTIDQVREAYRVPGINHCPRSRLLCIEQTTNMGGGRVWPLEQIRDVCDFAKQKGLARHMDGARLMNAVVKSGIPAEEYAAEFDSLWLDFSKGLGAPVGAVLAGDKDFIREAWRFKHQFGGAMRQAGVIAAACIHALENNVDRLAEDHEHARILAEGIGDLPGIAVEIPETNMVFFDVKELGLSAQEFAGKVLEHGVRLSSGGPTRMRAVTHLDVTRAGIDKAITAIRDVVNSVKK